jgi:hypothetical protein
MWRSFAAFLSIAGLLILMQLRVPNGMMGPNQPQPNQGNPAQQLADKKAKEQAELLRPFKEPHPFDASKEGYHVIFPGKPSPPQFRVINRWGTTWSYQENRLGNLVFTVYWDQRQKSEKPMSDRDYLAWQMAGYQKGLNKRVGIEDQRRVWTERYFKFKDKYEAAEVANGYHFVAQDDYYGPQLCRHWFIVTSDDLYQLEAEGNAEVVSSHFADDFFHSFELRPKFLQGP